MEHDGPSTSSRQWKGILEVRLGQQGALERRVIADTPALIGRHPSAQVFLDHDTVSRRHAELRLDPFGRWWIRDLGSTNGTLVNGERVTDRVLKPGDRLRVGDFHMNLAMPGDGGRVRDDSSDVSRPPFAAERDNHTAIRRLREFDQPTIAASQLFALMRFSRSLLTVEDPLERLVATTELLVSPEFCATSATALRVRPGGEYALLTETKRAGPNAADRSAPYVSRRVLRQIFDSAEPAMASNLVGGPIDLELTMSAQVMPVCVAATPLTRVEDEMDVLYAVLPPTCASVEWLALISLAGEAYLQAETAWAARRHAQANAAIERELEMARQIQHRLVPRHVAVPGLELEIGFEPCKWVGGDYVDVVPMPDGRTLLAVADVCGKGLQSALVTSSLHTLVRATVDAGRPPVAVMDRLNEYFGQYLPDHSFVTMVVAAIDPRTGALEMVNAGHPPAIVVGPDGSLRYLQVATNPALGVAPLPMEGQLDRLGRGEVLLMFTDGLTELLNPAGEMLGLGALASAFCRTVLGAQASVAVMGQGLHGILDTFREDRLPEDDRAFVIARRR